MRLRPTLAVVEVVHAVQVVDDGPRRHQLRAVSDARVKRGAKVGRRNVFFEKDPTLERFLAEEAVWSEINIVFVVVYVFVRR